jgi:hypothetical protein
MLLGQCSTSSEQNNISRGSIERRKERDGKATHLLVHHSRAYVFQCGLRDVMERSLVVEVSEDLAGRLSDVLFRVLKFRSKQGWVRRGGYQKASERSFDTSTAHKARRTHVPTQASAQLPSHPSSSRPSRPILVGPSTLRPFPSPARQSRPSSPSGPPPHPLHSRTPLQAFQPQAACERYPRFRALTRGWGGSREEESGSAERASG